MPKRKVAETSLEAWRSITQEQLSDHHAKILAALTDLKKASAEQISTHTNLHYWQITRRMSELERKNLIYKTGVKVATRTGRSAAVYALCKPDEVPVKETVSVLPGKSVSDYSKEMTKKCTQLNLL